jgi:anti-repressor protein
MLAYEFTEGVDYAAIDPPVLANQTGRGGDRRSIDYHLSLDMAKELSMVERTAKGKQARMYRWYAKNFIRGMLCREKKI